MRKSLLAVSLAVISMNVLGMNNRDIDRGNYSGAHLREITDLNNTGASTFSRKRARDDSDPQRSVQRRRISNSSDQIQLSDEVAEKIDDFIRNYGKSKNNANNYDKNLVKEVLTKILTEPNKAITKITEEYEISNSRGWDWLKKADLSHERKRLVNSYRDSKLRLAKAIFEYPKKGLDAAAQDNDVSRGSLSRVLRELSNEGKIVLKIDQKEQAKHQKKLDLLEAYYKGKNLKDLCEIFNKNEKETKRNLGELVYSTLTEEAEKQLLTEYSGLIKDNREGLLNQKGRCNKWGVSEIKDYLVLYVARKLAIEIKENPNIEEAAWWSKEFDPAPRGGDWWHHERELEYKTEREVPREIREKMVKLSNEGRLTRRGVAKVYKTKTSIVSNIFAHKATNNLADKKIGWGNLDEVISDLLTKSQDEVKTKYGYSDRTIRDRLVVIDHWRKLSDDQKNTFKKAIKTKKMPDLSAVEDSKVKKSRFINDNFRKYLFALTSTNEEIVERYYENIKRKDARVGELRQKAKIWSILAKLEIDLIKAVKDGDLEKMKDLIRKQTDVNCKDEYSQTPLMWAAAVGNADIVRYLIDHGANISHKDKNNENALTIAENFEHDEIINILKTA